MIGFCIHCQDGPLDIDAGGMCEECRRAYELRVLYVSGKVIQECDEREAAE